MERTTIDGTSIAVSRLGLGTGSLHHLFLSTNRRRLLDQAAAAGITHFDTSPYYGHGLAEAALGDFLCGRRDAFTVATKVGLYPKGPPARTGVGVWLRKAFGKLLPGSDLPAADWSVARARRSLEASLRRLRTDHVDFLFVHEPRVTIAAADSLHDWLGRERERGTLRAFGVAGVEDCVGPLVREGHPLAQIIQTRDSLMGREANFILRTGRPLQFTYGYLSNASQGRGDPLAVVRDARSRNPSGALIVSSRRPQRIAALASVFA